MNQSTTNLALGRFISLYAPKIPQPVTFQNGRIVATDFRPISDRGLQFPGVNRAPGASYVDHSTIIGNQFRHLYYLIRMYF